MATIKAPYNFVPLSSEVVSPHWVDQISHDIPFQDGLSGVIEVKIKAETPIFVKDGIGQKQGKDNYTDGVQNSPHTFSCYDGKYFIPGTSIKGMIRNVLEILSFGKMEGRVNDHKYAVRDFQNDTLYPKSDISKMVHCGWMRKENGEYILYDCGRPYRISHEELSEKFGIDIASFFQTKSNLGDKSAKRKYLRYQNILELKYFDIEEENHKNICKYNPDGDFQGRIVFTGQPSENKERGKHHEFVFAKREGEGITVPERVLNNFFFAYFDHDYNKQSIDWKYWKPKLEQGEDIPIFFRRFENKIIDIGLSMLYKIVYEKSVVETIRNTQSDDSSKYDLSDIIFGYTNNECSLKGRVYVGHAFSDDNTVELPQKSEVLSSPKASYYPTYIRQNGNTDESYKTFMDQKAIISGWKRYPVHNNGVKCTQPDDTNSQKIITKFIPLKEGAEFSCSIRYHNLRPVELGALLSALTFHNTPDTYHSIGMAKPLGYGKVSLRIVNNSLDIHRFMKDFEAYMNIKIPSWHKSDQVIELVTMAQNQLEDNLAYMKLNDHLAVKKEKEALGNYTKIVSNKAIIRTLCNTHDIDIIDSNRKNEEKWALDVSHIDNCVLDTLKQNKNEINNHLEEYKSKLLKKIEELLNQVKENERREIKSNIATNYSENGPVWDDIGGRNAWESLKTNIESWARSVHDDNNLRRIIQQYPNGFLFEKFHPTLFEKLKNIFDNLNQNDKVKWRERARNPYRDKVAEWVGREAANNFFDTL